MAVQALTGGAGVALEQRLTPSELAGGATVCKASLAAAMEAARAEGRAMKQSIARDEDPATRVRKDIATAKSTALSDHGVSDANMLSVDLLKREQVHEALTVLSYHEDALVAAFNIDAWQETRSSSVCL